MKKILFLAVLFALGANGVMAGNVNQQRAQRIGQQFLNTTVLSQRGGIQLQLVSTASDRGEVEDRKSTRLNSSHAL